MNINPHNHPAICKFCGNFDDNRGLIFSFMPDGFDGRCLEHIRDVKDAEYRIRDKWIKESDTCPSFIPIPTEEPYQYREYLPSIPTPKKEN